MQGDRLGTARLYLQRLPGKLYAPHWWKTDETSQEAQNLIYGQNGDHAKEKGPPRPASVVHPVWNTCYGHKTTENN